MVFSSITNWCKVELFFFFFNIMVLDKIVKGFKVFRTEILKPISIVFAAYLTIK